MNYTFCPHVWYPDCHTTFQRNLLWKDGYAPAGMREWPKDPGDLDYNLVHAPGVAKSRPANGLAKSGGDKHSLAGDAMFINPLAGDYGVKEGSPALTLGFKNFAMDQFGVQRPELKRLARTAPLPGTLEDASITSGGWMRPAHRPQSANWLGAKVKSIADRGEMSAYGLGDTQGVALVEVPKGSLAEMAGLRENDVIRGVNGQSFDSLSEFSKLWKQDAKPHKVKLTIWRNQAEKTVIFTLGEHEISPK